MTSEHLWRKLRISQPGDTFGALVKRVISTYSGDEKTLACLLLGWLCKNEESVYHPEKQTAKFRAMWHTLADSLGLKHYSIDFANYRFYCRKHEKICSCFFDNNEYDYEHECFYKESKLPCIGIHRLLERKHVYIIAPNTEINDVSTLMYYLKLNGDINKEPFAY